jgi:Mitochondrial large subunit ribosomal protein (Img2)
VVENVLNSFSNASKDGTKVVTRIKGVSGDINAFVLELRTLLRLPEPANGLAAYDAIRIRTVSNTIEVQRNVAHDVRTWLAGLGF